MAGKWRGKWWNFDFAKFNAGKHQLSRKFFPLVIVMKLFCQKATKKYKWSKSFLGVFLWSFITKQTPNWPHVIPDFLCVKFHYPLNVPRQRGRRGRMSPPFCFPSFLPELCRVPNGAECQIALNRSKQMIKNARKSVTAFLIWLRAFASPIWLWERLFTAQ